MEKKNLPKAKINHDNFVFHSFSLSVATSVTSYYKITTVATKESRIFDF